MNTKRQNIPVVDIAIVLAIATLSGCIGPTARLDIEALAEDLREGAFEMDTEVLARTPVSVTFPPAHQGCFASAGVRNVQVATVVDGKTRFEAWCVIMGVSRATGEHVVIGAWRLEQGMGGKW